MKTCKSVFRCSLAILTCVALASPAIINSAPPGTNASTNAGASDIPHSVFVQPKNQQQGRDPFFPDSIRPYGSVSTAPTNSSVSSASLVLNGLSGTGQKRLAIINGSTVAEGEESNIPTPTGRVRVRCVEIKDSSVIIEVGNELREIRLRSGN